MNLCLHFISKWQSFDNAEKDNRLEAGVEAIIIQIFNSLKRTFGADLIEGILAFLTFAVEGVTDTEMVDLLSLDDDILKFVFQYSTPKVRKLPYHVWLRVRSSLGTLLVEGEGGSYLWYHRQLKEVSNLFLSLLFLLFSIIIYSILYMYIETNLTALQLSIPSYVVILTAWL